MKKKPKGLSLFLNLFFGRISRVFYCSLILSCTPKATTLDSKQKEEGLLFMQEAEPLAAHLQKFKETFSTVTASEFNVLNENFVRWLAATARVDCEIAGGKIEGTVFITSEQGNYATAAHVLEDVFNCRLDLLRLLQGERLLSSSEVKTVSAKNAQVLNFKTAKSWSRDQDYLKLDFHPHFLLSGKTSKEGYTSGWDLDLGEIKFGQKSIVKSLVNVFSSQTKYNFMRVEKETDAKVGDGVVLICRSGTNESHGPMVSGPNAEVSAEMAAGFSVPTSERFESESLQKCTHFLKGTKVPLDSDFDNCLAEEKSNLQGKRRTKSFLMGPDFGFNLGYGHITRLGKVHVYFDIDAFQGCSGGPVLNLRTGNLLGVLQSRTSTQQDTSGREYTTKNYFFGNAVATILTEESLAVLKRVSSQNQ
jgi:hypothetical protein